MKITQQCPIFAFYGFKVSKQKDEEELFKEQEEENGKQLAQYDSPEACFGSFFKTGGKLSLNVLKEKGKGTPADTITRLRTTNPTTVYHHCPRFCIARAGSFRPSFALYW